MIVLLIFLIGSSTPDPSRIIRFSTPSDCYSATRVISNSPPWWKVECRNSVDGELLFFLLQG